MLCEFEAREVPQDYEAEAQAPHDPQYCGGEGPSKLRQEDIGENEEESTGDGEVQLSASPEVVEEHGLAWNGPDEAEELQTSN